MHPSHEAAAGPPGAEPDLVLSACEGNLDAFNGLVDRHQRSVFNLCLRMLGSREAAEDATQDAFLAAFRNVRSFRGQSFRAWLMRIAANACTDELRRRGRRPAHSLDAPPPGADDPLDIADAAAGPEALLLRKEQQAALQAALLRLPPDQRMAVIMCDLQGFSYEEIAEAMRSSLGTVKSRIARGREKLRAQVGIEGEHSEARERL
ncbi:MAG: sigma-70 family RNA polymerase sigma factor [Dehalococcoidia bacterium]|nr:MAG: sigma-70 family RNA polymerase sigma factor [Dehalococcoidia bacterium]